MINKQTIILFDLDGTLLDSTEAILKSFDDSYKHFGLTTPNDEDIKALIGHPLDYMYSHLGIQEKKVWDFVDVYKMHYRKRSKPMTKFLPYATEAIHEASKFARLGVVTTKTGTYSRELLQHMRVMDYFEVLIGREDVTNPKPHSEPILKALNDMNIKSFESTWMIGDTSLDMDSAKSAGINSIGVTCGYGSLEQLESCTNIIQTNAKDAVLYIQKEYIK